jgi:glycerol-3-phosphate cytidylyltransferase
MKRYKIGYTTGTFDLFHVGHLNILRNAKELCEILIVGISTDELVLNYKKRLPIIPFEQRTSIVEAIRYVDLVVPQTDMDKASAVNRLICDVYFVGDDWKDTPEFNFYEKQLCVPVIYLPRTQYVSTQEIRRKIKLSN